MDNFRKIFVAIDFSPGSDEALRHGHERAASTGAQLAVCHIVPNELRSNLLFPQISRVTALKFPLEVKRIAEAASARVTEITGRSQEEFELIIDDGTPQALILSTAEQWLADLISWAVTVKPVLRMPFSVASPTVSSATLIVLC